MSASDVVWINGELHDAASAHVSPFDHGLTVGDGVFETLKIVDGEPFALRRHLDRLRRSADGLALDIPSRTPSSAPRSPTTIDGQRPRTAVACASPSPAGSARSAPTAAAPAPSVIIAVATPAPVAGQRDRGHRAVAPQRAQRGGRPEDHLYAENVVALGHAHEQGADEAIFANTAGDLCEGTGTQRLRRRRRAALHAAAVVGCLAGITREPVDRDWSTSIEVDLPIERLGRGRRGVPHVVSTRDVQPIARDRRARAARVSRSAHRAAADAFADAARPRPRVADADLGPPSSQVGARGGRRRRPRPRARTPPSSTTQVPVGGDVDGVAGERTVVPSSTRTGRAERGATAARYRSTSRRRPAASSSATRHSSSRCSEREQQVLAVDLVADDVVERDGDLGELGGQVGRPVHVDADARPPRRRSWSSSTIDSARMPASLPRSSPSAPTTTRSFGHLRRASAAGDLGTGLGRGARPPPWSTQVGVGGRERGPQQDRHQQRAARRRLPVRSSRPRPAVWWSATSTMPSGAPSRASASRSSLVELGLGHPPDVGESRYLPSADLARDPCIPVTIWRAHTRSSSPTAARSLSVSSVPARSWASPPSPSTPSSTATRSTSASPTRPTRLGGQTAAESYLNTDTILDVIERSRRRRRAPRLRLLLREHRLRPGHHRAGRAPSSARRPRPSRSWATRCRSRIAAAGGRRAGRARHHRVPDERRRGRRLRRGATAGRSPSRPPTAAAVAACASCNAADEAADGLRVGPVRGAQGLRARRVLRRALPHLAPPRRDADHRRHARQLRVGRRARLLGPAPPPEAHRGDARRRPSPPRSARPWARPPSRSPQACGYVQRRHRRVPLPGRRVLLPRDEHPAPGRAPRHRAGVGHRPRAPSRSGWRRASRCRSARTTSTCAATPSRSASTPRTRPAASSSRRPGASPRSSRRRASAPAGTAATSPATRSASTTTTSSASSSCGAPTATPPSAACCGRSSEFRIEGIATTIPADLAILEHPDFAAGQALDQVGRGHARPLRRRAPRPSPRRPSDDAEPKVRRDVDVEVNGKRFAVSVWVPESAAGRRPPAAGAAGGPSPPGGRRRVPARPWPARAPSPCRCRARS